MTLGIRTLNILDTKRHPVGVRYNEVDCTVDLFTYQNYRIPKTDACVTSYDTVTVRARV